MLQIRCGGDTIDNYNSRLVSDDAFSDNSFIAVDVMGGDKGPEVRVEGAIQAFKDLGIKSILVGDQAVLNSLLKGLGAQSLPLEVCHASEVIGMGDSPTRAVRRKPDSSLCVALNLLVEGRAAGAVSAGNSGAVMAAGGIICGRLPGIERPAIATIVPAVGNRPQKVVLDSGANVDCHADHLVQFALMGAIYYSSFFGIDNPRVAILSNGEESSKGTDITRTAASILSDLGTVDFVGYVEGRDLNNDKAHVVVCDGFVGNVVLKAMEGTVRLLLEQLKLEVKASYLGRIGMLFMKRILREVFQVKFDYSTYGGAPLLGLSELVLVLHGSSGVKAVRNAVRVADMFARKRMTELIAESISGLEDVLNHTGEDIVQEVLSGGNKEVPLLSKKRDI